MSSVKRANVQLNVVSSTGGCVCLSPAAVNGGGDGHCTWQECLQAAFRQVYKIYYVRMDLGSWYVVAYCGILVLAATLDIRATLTFFFVVFVAFHLQSQSELELCAAFMQIDRSLEDRAITHYIHLLYCSTVSYYGICSYINST